MIGLLRHALNIGIVAACFGMFVSLSDFIISPKAKKRLEEFIDELTLRLDYTKTIDWLQNWLRTTRRMSIAMGVSRVLSILFLAAFVFYVEMLIPSFLPEGWKRLLRICLLVFFAVSYYKSKKKLKLDPKIFKWLAEATSYPMLIKRYFAVMIAGGGVLIFMSFMSAFYLRGGLASLNNVNPLAFWVVYFTALLWIYWIALIADGTITLIVAVGIFIARYSIEGSKWLMWRISTYPKGPLTATLTLAGASLAILKLVISK